MGGSVKILGNPVNAVKALFDKEIPLWFRLTVGIFGALAWARLFFLVKDGK
jgi:hypothetical protein